MKVSPYTIYLGMQPNGLLVQQNFIICKKWVLHHPLDKEIPGSKRHDATLGRQNKQDKETSFPTFFSLLVITLASMLAVQECHGTGRQAYP
jgi:hypothetical protein